MNTIFNLTQRVRHIGAIVPSVVMIGTFILMTACGKSGNAIEDGQECYSVQQPGYLVLTCGDLVVHVPDAKPGEPGADGQNGVDGSSCSVFQEDGGARIQCTDGSEAFVSHGSDGADGLDGADGIDGIDGLDGAPAELPPTSIVEVIDLCGNASNFGEVLLRLANGQLLAHYSQGNKQHFVLVEPNSYVSTDGFSCFFTVDADLTVTDEEGNTWEAP